MPPTEPSLSSNPPPGWATPVYEGQLAGAEVVGFDLAGDDAAVASARLLLDDAERTRADRFVQDQHRRRYTLAHGHVRRLIGARLGIGPAAVAFVTGAAGKPEIAPALNPHGLRFNLTHSHDLALVAMAWGHTVGVDVEYIRPMDDIARLAADHFSPAETAALADVPEAERQRAFFSVWTRKEAFVKALGAGLGYPLASFDVSVAPGAPARLLRVGADAGSPGDWEIATFAPLPGFVATVVVGARA